MVGAGVPDGVLQAALCPVSQLVTGSRYFPGSQKSSFQSRGLHRELGVSL